MRRLRWRGHKWKCWKIFKCSLHNKPVKEWLIFLSNMTTLQSVKQFSEVKLTINLCRCWSGICDKLVHKKNPFKYIIIRRAWYSASECVGCYYKQKERKLFQVYINLSGGVSVSGVRPFAHSKNNVALRFLTFINFQGSQRPVNSWLLSKN